MIRILFSALLAGLLLQSCLKKPEACAELDTYYEQNREIAFESCSKDYDFLTWDFGDGSHGFIGDSPKHTFRDTGSYIIRLTAYGKGGYRSDVYEGRIKVRPRVVDRYEIVGNLDYNKIEIEFLETIAFSGVQGTYTDESPLIAGVWPEDTLVMPLENVTLRLSGPASAGSPTLLRASQNLEYHTENPIEFSNTQYVVRVYWIFHP
ncbi:MAG: hypothetical protein Kow0075_06930 [Salibacteraceae bacterium]